MAAHLGIACGCCAAWRRSLALLRGISCRSVTVQHGDGELHGSVALQHCFAPLHRSVTSQHGDASVLTACCRLAAGTTTMEQLKENISAFDIELSEATLKAVDAIHVTLRNPNSTD